MTFGIFKFCSRIPKEGFKSRFIQGIKKIKTKGCGFSKLLKALKWKGIQKNSHNIKSNSNNTSHKIVTQGVPSFFRIHHFGELSVSFKFLEAKIRMLNNSMLL